MKRTSGGQPGHPVSAETRAKIRAALTGRKGPPSPHKGTKKDPAIGAKISASLRKWDPVCAFEGCTNATKAFGFCTTHYRRLRLYGDPGSLKGVPSGSNHPNWKGDEGRYDTIHVRLRKLLPKTCATCGAATGRLEVALLRTTPTERLKSDPTHGPYSVNAADYVRLCVPCHRRYDSPRADTRATIERLLAPASL